jgi:hypothetical protein
MFVPPGAERCSRGIVVSRYAWKRFQLTSGLLF